MAPVKRAMKAFSYLPTHKSWRSYHSKSANITLCGLSSNIIIRDWNRPNNSKTGFVLSLMLAAMCPCNGVNYLYSLKIHTLKL